MLRELRLGDRGLSAKHGLLTYILQLKHVIRYFRPIYNPIKQSLCRNKAKPEVLLEPQALEPPWNLIADLQSAQPEMAPVRMALLYH